MSHPVDPPTLPSPLAEGRWLWRRLYVFASSRERSANQSSMAVSSAAMTPPEAALPLAKGLMALLALTMILYLVAPTAQQLIASLRSLRPPLGGEGG